MSAEIQPELLLFFDGHLSALPMFQALEERLYALFPDAGRRVQKTQITYFSRYVFACVSFLRVKRKAEMPEAYIVLTLGLPYPLDSDRVPVKCESYPGRWTNHVLIGSLRELDDELFSWLREAYAFSSRKRQGKGKRLDTE